MPIVFAEALGALCFAEPSAAQTEEAAGTVPQAQVTYPGLPSEMPATFEPVFDDFDHTRRDVMIAMRDGVKLLRRLVMGFLWSFVQPLGSLALFTSA